MTITGNHEPIKCFLCENDSEWVVISKGVYDCRRIFDYHLCTSCLVKFIKKYNGQEIYRYNRLNAG